MLSIPASRETVRLHLGKQAKTSAPATGGFRLRHYGCTNRQPRELTILRTKLSTHSHQRFTQYYREQSGSPETWDRFDRIFSGLLSLVEKAANGKPLRVCDIGGGAGTLSRVIASYGHKPTCIDLNEALIETGRQRALEDGLNIDFRVASATEVPFPDETFDLCVMAELLEHVEDWETCLDEIARVLKPGGAVFLSTTNAMCPRQSEFNLPLYSWYPTPLKRYWLRRAQTDRPDLANFATYPAFHWFTFASLRTALRKRGFTKFFDRFDLSLARGAFGLKKPVYTVITSTALTRFLAYFTTESSVIIAVKDLKTQSRAGDF